MEFYVRSFGRRQIQEMTVIGFESGEACPPEYFGDLVLERLLLADLLLEDM